jgi:hypothetical protein
MVTSSNLRRIVVERLETVCQALATLWKTKTEHRMLFSLSLTRVPLYQTKELSEAFLASYIVFIRRSANVEACSSFGLPGLGRSWLASYIQHDYNSAA